MPCFTTESISDERLWVAIRKSVVDLIIIGLLIRVRLLREVLSIFV